ncbi:molybdopterin biosynthesis protein MoeB [Amylibacter kogurei]|uniref:Molybdopterin-synthase adenylyltransferase n=1 Tax=Paramylibacter kogurei TaxID=1889778 RepID=A0A2G5K3I4_9RHOB|nr:HesA/MoeB/ThiF family protein [Amylibacter kogurei]PIB23955.1 molybdopterin biosynthesis protein MoeB [Amylibacter kogurei]
MEFLKSLIPSISAEGAVLIALLAAVFLYLWFLRGMRKNAVEKMNETPNSDGFSDTELERYARHIVLREIGGAGQTKLSKARVLIIGAGGLGSPVLQYLAAAGVGTIGVIDDDTVSLSNLQRQVLFDEDQLDKPKVFAAQQRLHAINPHVEVLPYHRRLEEKDARDLIGEFDLVLDGCDNFKTRSMVNAACVATDVPLISGAISQWEGQVSLFHPKIGSPCYACVFDKEPSAGQAPSCAEAGVMGALPGIVGAMMATEAIKYITGAGKTLTGEMIFVDALFGENRKMKLSRRADCAVCGAKQQ